jgi:hypothetical protein
LHPNLAVFELHIHISQERISENLQQNATAEWGNLEISLLKPTNQPDWLLTIPRDKLQNDPNNSNYWKYNSTQNDNRKTRVLLIGQAIDGDKVNIEKIQIIVILHYADILQMTKSEGLKLRLINMAIGELSPDNKSFDLEIKLYSKSSNSCLFKLDATDKTFYDRRSSKQKLTVTDENWLNCSNGK